MNLDSIRLMFVFSRVVELSSFTLAAERLGVSPSAASKAVARLEERLGVRLVVRTTRSVRPTEEGEILLASCRVVLSELEDTEARLSTRAQGFAGNLRIHTTVNFGRLVLAPLLIELSSRWPLLKLDLEMSDRQPNLEQEPFDLAVVVGPVTGMSVIGRLLGRVPLVVVASPDYLETHPAPQTLDDLKNHECLGFFDSRTHRYRDWEFKEDQVRLAVFGQLNFNNSLAVLDAAIAGRGIAQVARSAAQEALAGGQLVEVLSDFAPSGWPLSLIYLERRYQTRRVKVCVDFLVERLQADQRWQS